MTKSDSFSSMLKGYFWWLSLGFSMIFFLIVVFFLIIAFISPYSMFDFSKTHDMGLKNFQDNKILYRNISECIEAENGRTEKCMKIERDSWINLLSNKYNFRTGLCGNQFSGDYVSIGVLNSEFQTNTYYVHVLSGSKFLDSVNTSVPGALIATQDGQKIMYLDKDWIMCWDLK